ncbi:MAG: hypothetical protein Q9167_001587 [Letrouitia subvulpina]
MSTQQYSREADDQYEAQNDAAAEVTGDVTDSSYAHPETKGQIPVQGDNVNVEDPIDVNTANSDAQLAQDDADAIDQSNVIGSRTRGAKPTTGYSEGPDEDDLPEQTADTGRSSTR